jgi:hypothetical protein
MPADLTSVDQNLQAIQAVERSWALPSLPDEVKLDLAGNGLMTPPAMQSLLTGLATDLDQAGRQQALPTRFDMGVEEPTNPSYGYDKPTDIGRTVASVVGLPTPQVYDVKAPQRLKQRLVEGGYLALEPEEVQSDRWLPEYSYAARQLNFDEMSAQFQGNKPGSVSTNQLMQVVDEWLTPRGLYRAAVELDLWWDTGAIKKEFQEWDEKLASWREDPLDPRKLIDLVTGPLDDLLFPALNIALLFTGIGEVVATAKGLQLGVKGSQAVAGLYRGAKGLDFAAAAADDIGRMALRGADDVARFSRPSFVSNKIQGAMPTTSRAMNAWRQNGAVILGKKANQQVMKMGFVSNVEQLIDSDRGGQSLNRFTSIGENINTAMANPMVDWGVDLLLTPPNIFSLGTFARPGHAIINTVTGGFRKAAQNQELTMAFDRPIVRYLTESEGEEAAAAYTARVNKDGVQAAIRDTFFKGDEEAMGAGMAFVATMAGVDHHARRAADVIAGDPLHELGSRTRTFFHMARNQTAARLKVIDEDNIEGMLIHFAKYGTVEGAPVVYRRADKFGFQYQSLREGYLEAAGATKARAGSIPADHTRFIGHLDPDTGQYSWSPLRAGDEIEGDPYFLDVYDAELRGSLGDEADAILGGDTPLPDAFINRYLRRDNDGKLRHWALSEANQMRLYDPEKIQLLRDMARHHNDLRASALAEIMNDLSPAALEQYVYEVLPTFGRWDDFVEASGEIRRTLDQGQLGNAKFVSPMSDMNRRLGAMPWTPDERKWVNEVFAIITELPDNPKLAGQLMDSVFSPFARDVDPQLGTFTAAAHDTVTKQEALAFASTARRTVKMAQALRKLKMTESGQNLLRAAQGYLDETDTVKRAGLVEVLTEAFGSVSENTLSDLTKIAKLAEEAKVSLDEIEDVITRQLGEIDALPVWAERYMVPTSMKPTGNLVQDVQNKITELQKQAYFMASEVEGIPDDLVRFLADRKYKLVYGVEFAQPFDLDGIMPAFADASRRQMRQKSLGDFFDRQDPAMLSALKSRKVRDGLHARLTKVSAPGGKALNLGPRVDPKNADLNMVMEDLWHMLRTVQDEAQTNLESLGSRGIISRVAGRASLNQIPFSLDRLASDLPKESFMEAITGYGYSRAQGSAIYQALQSSQALGFKTHGLYAIESKLRSSPNLINATRLASVVGGSVAGGYAANRFLIPEGEDPTSFENIGKRVAGVAAGGVLGAVGGQAAARGLRASIDAGGTALRWAYLADGLANIRDKVRFSLSPIFDASRYSEATILGQIGEMPEGLRNLRVNQSPTAFRRAAAREFRAGGMDQDAARRAANAQWHRYRDEFAAAARGYRDFDWEVIDGVGRRFSSVGILGFSPTDWMTSTYSHMRKAGVSENAAYTAVRDIYTYGTTGRSAGELSMNFVFFPFSFTKKTVTHLSKFFSDDLSRLVILHDMFATYQLLDQHYDLNQEWKDRLPILQKAHRLNLLAYGIGLGQFGGVNQPLIEAASRLPGISDVVDVVPGMEEVVNAFIPQMVPMNSAEDADSAWDTARQMLPMINDVNTMIGSLVEQGRVIASPEHISSQAEQRRAWDEWRNFQTEMMTSLDAAGVTWNQATRAPELNALIQKERARISAKYPTWKQGMGDGIAHSAAIDMELGERVQFPKSEGDVMLAEFHDLMNLTEDTVGISFEGSPEEMPPEFFDIFRRIAIDNAGKSPEFLRLYNRFYRRSLGDITTELR